MENKLSNLYIFTTIIYQALYIMAIHTGLDFRLDRLLILPLILYNYYSSIHIVLLKNISKEVKLINVFIQLFISLYFIAAVFYSFNNTTDVVFSYLPTVILVLPTVVSCILISYKGFFDKKKMFLLAFIFFLFGMYSFYKVYTQKVGILGDEFYKHSNNSGYYFVLVAPLLFYTLQKVKITAIITLTILFVFVLFAAKRGAILIYLVCYVSFCYAIFKDSSKKTKLIFSLVLTAIGVSALILFKDTIELLLYRFSLEGGSGRDGIYSGVLNSFYNSSFFEAFFGHGFFSVLKVTEDIFGFPIMAHSDYLEIILDLGIIGITIYAFILLLLIYYVNRIPLRMYYERFTLKIAMIIWILKAIFSGVFMVKDSIILLLTIGLIVGIVEFKKGMIEKNIINSSK